MKKEVHSRPSKPAPEAYGRCQTHRNSGRILSFLQNQRGGISIYTCFFIVGIAMLVSFLLLYASIRITCINIRNGAKMELNNLSASIYADTFRSQRETNFSEYLNTLYSSGDYTAMLEEAVADGLSSKIPLSTEDYTVYISLPIGFGLSIVEQIKNMVKDIMGKDEETKEEVAE